MYLPSVSHDESPPFSLSRSDCIQRRATLGTRADSKSRCLSGEPLYVPTRPNPIQRSDNWFGGDGKEAGFSRRTVRRIIGCPDSPIYRQSMALFTLQFYARAFEGITVMEACRLLRCLGCDQDAIYRYSNYEAGFRLMSARKISIIYQKSPLCTAINYFPMAFVGGPPGKLYGRKGTLLTMLLDRITVVTLLEGAKAIDRIIPPDAQKKIMA